MKKIIIYLLIISVLFLNFNFTKAQLGFLNFSSVPVNDSQVARILVNILGFLQDELKRLNLSVLYIIQTQIQEMSKEMANDTMKAQQYIEILSEEEKMLEKRKEKANSIEEHTKALEEAEIAGAYLGLQDFIESIGSCINPRIRNELTSYIMKISERFNIEKKAEELLNEIPDCPEEELELQTPNLNTKLFVWLIQPFKLNLAQVSQNNNDEISAIVITPAFQETEDSIELSNLQNLGFDLINEKARKKKEERKKQIGEIWPIELCKKNIVDKNIDEGNFICEEYEILIEGEDLKRFRQELALNKPDQNELLNTSHKNNLIQAGIKTTLTEELFNFLDPYQEIAEKLCAPYTAGETNLDKTYGICLKMLAEQFKNITNIQKKKAEWKKEETEKAKNKFQEAKTKAESLKSKGGLNNCEKASKDLDNIIVQLTFKIDIFSKFINDISKKISDFNRLNNQINNYLTDIVYSMNKILSIISLLENSAFKNLILNTLALIAIQTNIETLYNNIVDNLKKLRKSMGDNVGEILSNFESLLKPFTDLMTEYQTLLYNLHKDNLTSSSVLNDLYELELILQKLDAYERAIEKGECSGEATSENISLIKNQVIVVESKNKENKSFNFLASLKNLFKPKLVEIKNEK